MKKQPVKDLLDEIAKEDLVVWIRNQHFHQPKRSDLLYIQWQRQSAEVLEEMQKENRSLDGVDFRERDRLAVKFNESRDPKEKMRLLDLMSPYNKAMSDHLKRSQAIDRKSKRVDALYEQIDVERKKESGRRSA